MGMPDDTEIFEHIMQKRIGNTEYWREIALFCLQQSKNDGWPLPSAA
jgi:hypothetical protein